MVKSYNLVGDEKKEKGKMKKNETPTDEVCNEIEELCEQSAALSDKELKEQKRIEELAKQYDRAHKKRDKKTIVKSVLRVVFLVALIALSFVILFEISDYVSGGNQVSFTELFKNAHLTGVFILIGVILLAFFLETFKYCYLFKAATGKFYLRASMKVQIFGKFYDGITPFTIGGQPFQIYYLHKKNIPVGLASAVPLIRFFFSIVVWCLFSAAMLILCPFIVEKMPATLSIRIVAWVSLIVNLMIPLAVLMVTIFPKGGKKLLIRIYWFLHRIHLMKRYYTRCKALLKEIDEYRNTIKNFFKHPAYYIPIILICLLECIVTTSIPYFVVTAFTDVQGSMLLYWQIMSLCCLAQLSASLIPTPGTTGAVEATSAIMFATVTGIDSYVGWIILIWRFFIYYVYIIAGVGVNIFDTIRSFVRDKRKARAERELANGSPPENDQT